MTSAPDVLPAGSARSTPASSALLLAAVLGLGGLLASGLVFLDLSRAHGLFGVTQYDDGVYFASAVELVSGKLPYKDFVFLQPPGITLLMAPLAGLVHDSRHALGAARILTALVAGANVVLAGALVRHRGIAASFICALAIAVFPPAYAADHTLLLEPYLVLFSLIGALIIFRSEELASNRSLLLGGLFLGFAGTLKIWGLLPAAAALLCVLRQRRRAAPWFIVAVAIGFGLPCAPFLLAAPHAFFHEVIATQLQRGAATVTPIAERIAALTGVAYLSKGIGLGAHSPYPDVVLAILGALILFGNISPALRRRASSVELFVLLSLIGAIAALLLPKQFFDHYAYFSAVFLALCLGLGAARGLALLRRLLGAEDRAARHARHYRLINAVLVLVVIAGSSAIVLSTARYDEQEIDNAGDPGRTIARAIPTGSCAVSDASVLLILADRFSPNSARCPSILDSSGAWLALDPTHADPGDKHLDPEVVALWHNAFAHADYVVLSNPTTFRIPWTAGLMEYFRTHFQRLALPNANVYRRLPAAKASAP